MIILLYMRAGSLWCRSQGNANWNLSAPYGAGCLVRRVKAKNVLDLNGFKRQMDGIYTTSVNQNILGETPLAYKNAAGILDTLMIRQR